MFNIQKRTIHLIAMVFSTLIATFIIYWLITSFHMGNERLFHPWYIVASLFFMLLQKMIAPLIIMVIFQSINQKSSYWPLLWITMFSTAANSSVPFPAGLPVRIFLQKKIMNIPYTFSTSGLFIEMFLSYTCMIITCILTGLLFLGPLFNQQLFLLKNSITYNLTTIGLVLLSVSLIYFVVYRFKGKVVEYLFQATEQILKARYKTLFWSVCLIMISILISLLRLEMLLYAMGFYISPWSLLPAMLLSYLAGVISFIPMGLGVRDISLGGLLVFLGIPLTSAAVVTTIDRILLTIVYLVGSLIATHIFGKHLGTTI
ncbi:membrane protein [Candidatus Magnetomorum sp. HK-1]|nr:membrane protein [Candidatus Magnetomorum sp. HK-1]